MRANHDLHWTVAVLMAVALLFGAASAFGQNAFVTNYSPFLTVTLTNTETEVVYVLFPAEGSSWTISTTLPTKYRANATSGRRRPTSGFEQFGDLTLNIEPTTTSGTTDSLAVWMKPLIWDPVDEEFAVIESDSMLMMFGQTNLYYADSTGQSGHYLDWDTTVEYSCLLTGWVWPHAGLAVYFRQESAAAVMTTTIWFSWTELLLR